MSTNILNGCKQYSHPLDKCKKKVAVPEGTESIYKISSPILSFDPLPVIPRTNARDPGKKT